MSAHPESIYSASLFPHFAATALFQNLSWATGGEGCGRELIGVISLWRRMQQDLKL